ncbi:MAG: 16S rRNA (guanine(966)-N(2))-methyltransferase RsmD [Candidatus Caldatribacteriaceae bacterium]
MGYLHIVGGTMRGRKIVTPPGYGVRPMPASLRKSIFEILREAIPGKTVYDLFAGSGILGFEALSRGAKKVYFVERDIKICRLLERNLSILELGEKSKVLCVDFLSLQDFPYSWERPEIVFADPPFAMDCSRVLLKMESLKEFFQDALLVIRYPQNQHPFSGPSCFQRIDLRKYGESVVFFGCLGKNFD